MQVTVTRTIQLAEVHPERDLRLDALVNILQETALAHTRHVGIELCSLLDSGKTWVLSRMALNFTRLPRLEEELEVQTWSRRIQRFKGLRDFIFRIGGQQVGAATSLWLYFDIARRRPTRAPDHYGELYGTEDIPALAMDIEEWQPPREVRDERPLTITTRLSDYDVNGHVNNAIALQYLETALARRGMTVRQPIALQLAFSKEIPAGIDEIEVSLEPNGAGCAVQLRHHETIFVSSTISQQMPG
ncbi:MAG: acyl-[acyl-carrier-protein] thioesterase [Desulfopila sp.]